MENFFVLLLINACIFQIGNCEDGIGHGDLEQGQVDVGRNASNGHSSNASHVHHDIHVASWNYDYVGKPLLVTLFIVAVCAIKIRKSYFFAIGRIKREKILFSVFKHAHRVEAIIPESW